MTVQLTTVQGIAYCDDQTAIKDYPSMTQQAAQTIDTALGRFGIVPQNAADFMAQVAAAGGMGVQAAVTSTTGFAPNTGWAVTTVRARKLGFGMAYLRLIVTYTGATALAPPADGNIGNQTILTVPSTWVPLEEVAISTGGTGPMWAGILQTTGVLQLGAFANAVAFPTNGQLSCAMTYRLATP